MTPVRRASSAADAAGASVRPTRGRVRTSAVCQSASMALTIISLANFATPGALEPSAERGSTIHPTQSAQWKSPTREAKTQATDEA